MVIGRIEKVVLIICPFEFKKLRDLMLNLHFDRLLVIETPYGTKEYLQFVILLLLVVEYLLYLVDHAEELTDYDREKCDAEKDHQGT